MHQGLTILLLGYFPKMEPKFFLLLGLFLLFSKVLAAPPEFVCGINHWNDCFSPFLHGKGSTSHATFIIPWTLKSTLLQPHPSQGKKNKATFQEPREVEAERLPGQRTYFSSVLYTGAIAFLLTITQEGRHCYSIINNNTFYTESESSLWYVLWYFLLIFEMHSLKRIPLIGRETPGCSDSKMLKMLRKINCYRMREGDLTVLSKKKFVFPKTLSERIRLTTNIFKSISMKTL